MATYKRIDFSTILEVQPGLDYTFEAYKILGSAPATGRHYTSNLTDPLQQVGTVIQSVVSDYQLAANGISGIRASFDQHGIGLPGGVSGSPYSVTLLGSGGSGGPYTFELHSGTLPSGLTLSDGVISGTPDTSGPFTFNIRVYDAMGRWYNEDMSITIS